MSYEAVAVPMRGDLHTLKRMCSYGSKVMAAGTVVLAAVVAFILLLGAYALAAGSAPDILLEIIGAGSDDSFGTMAFSFIETLSVFVLGTLTVSAARRLMSSISTEHTPFTAGNTRLVSGLSKQYLVGAIVISVSELASGGDPADGAFMLFGCLLVSVGLFMFALMIRYGSVLQNEWDHTLRGMEWP